DAGVVPADTQNILPIHTHFQEVIAFDPRKRIGRLIDDRVSRLRQEGVVIVCQHTRQRYERNELWLVAIEIYRSPLTAKPKHVGYVVAESGNQSRSDEVSGGRLKSINAAREWRFKAVGGDIGKCPGNNAAQNKFNLVRTNVPVLE